MKVKALISFCGKEAMTCGEVKDIKDKAVLDDLLNAGFVIAEKKEKKEGKK